MEQNMTMGKRIAALRKKANLTQDALAKKLGVSPQAVSKWENDLSCPDIMLLPKLARILGITTDELLGGVEENQEQKEEPETPEPPPVIHVESVDGNRFDVRFDPPRGIGVAVAVWIMLTGALMLAGPLLQRESIGLWLSLLLSGVLVFSVRSMRKGIGFFNFTLFLLGVFTTLSALSVIGGKLDWSLVLPGMIVLFGLFLLINQFRRKKHGINRSFRFTGPHSVTPSDIRMTDGHLVYSSSFGEDHYRVQTPLFTGGEINVSFGEHTLDFSGVDAVAPDCRVEVNSSFGEICLEIPRRFQADLSLSKAFANAEVYGHSDPNPEAVILIDANLSFGELEIHYV